MCASTLVVYLHVSFVVVSFVPLTYSRNSYVRVTASSTVAMTLPTYWSTRVVNICGIDIQAYFTSSSMQFLVELDTYFNVT